MEVVRPPAAKPAIGAAQPGVAAPGGEPPRDQGGDHADADGELQRHRVERAQDGDSGDRARDGRAHDQHRLAPGRLRAAAFAGEREQVDLAAEQGEQADGLGGLEDGERERRGDQREAEAGGRLQRRPGRHSHAREYRHQSSRSSRCAASQAVCRGITRAISTRASGPTRTSPHRTAVGAIHALGCTSGLLPRCSTNTPPSIPVMAWDFSTEPEFEAQLAWMREFVRDEVWPIETVFDELGQDGFRRRSLRCRSGSASAACGRRTCRPSSAARGSARSSSA